MESEDKKIVSPLKALVSNMTPALSKPPVKVIPKEKVLKMAAEEPVMLKLEEAVPQQVNVSNVTINITIDGENIKQTLQDVSARIATGVAVFGGVAAAAMLFNGLKQLPNPNSLERRSNRVKLPPLPKIRLPKL